jgi:hypothetical protein
MDKLLHSVDVGDDARTFGIGDYLNAVDDLTCYFREFRDIEDKDYANALRLYANYVEGE